MTAPPSRAADRAPGPAPSPAPLDALAARYLDHARFEKRLAERTLAL